QSGTAYTPTTVPLGNVKPSCGKGATAQQSQQVSYQQQQQASCVPQFEFYDSTVISSLDINLDCENNVVRTRCTDGSGAQAALPIGPGGQVRGNMQFQKPVQNDGYGHTSCWVTTIIHFDGTASCR